MVMFGEESGRRLIMQLRRRKLASFTNILLSVSAPRDLGVKPESFKR
jgi:hypothetical protein